MDLERPEKFGMSSQGLGRIRLVMERYVTQKKLPGAITLIARRGKVVHFETYGWMDIEAGKPMQCDTLFQIQSITKSVTAIALMLLFEQGHFQLMDPVCSFIPAVGDLQVFSTSTGSRIESVPAEREITLFDLLTHTSGLSYASQISHPAFSAIRRKVDLARPGSTLEKRVEKLAGLPLAHHPGQMWRYGFSYDVLAFLVERISGMGFDAFLKEHLFEPLGMADTGYVVPVEMAGRLAGVYGPAADGGLERLDTDLDLFHPERPPLGSTGLVSTASDFLRLAQMMLNRGTYQGVRILRPETAEMMTANHLTDQLLSSFCVVGFGDATYTNGYGFGLGFRTLMDVERTGIPGSAGEYGWSGVYNTHYWIDPGEELIGLIWTQLSLPLHMVPIEREFKQLTYTSLLNA